MNKIFLSSPHISKEGYEKQYIKEAFDSNWIAPLGKNVDEFEKELSMYLNSKRVVALSSGTSAIHMALKTLNVKKGDFVICSNLTFAATCNPIIYENAIPVFVDSEYDTYNMSPKALELALQKYPEAKAVIIVHLYGTPSKIDEILDICKRYNVELIEDSCESLGATYKNKQTGTFGKCGTISFNGNKIITTSGGGALITDDVNIAEKVRYLSTQAREKVLHYEHCEIGYNYRMSNVLAGIGRGQLKVLDKRIEKKTQIYELYKKEFSDIVELNMQPYLKYSSPNHWLSVMYLNNKLKIDTLKIIKSLQQNNIEARPVWKPMDIQPVFCKYDYIKLGSNSISKDLYLRGICLPSDTKMTLEEQMNVIKIVKEEIKCTKNI